MNFINVAYHVVCFREEIKMEFYWGTHLSEQQFEWVFNLFATNMQEMYRKSEWGYDEVS